MIGKFTEKKQGMVNIPMGSGDWKLSYTLPSPPRIGSPKSLCQTITNPVTRSELDNHATACEEITNSDVIFKLIDVAEFSTGRISRNLVSEPHGTLRLK